MESGCAFIVFVLIVITVLVGLGMLITQAAHQKEQISGLTEELALQKQRYAMLEKEYKTSEKEKEDLKKECETLKAEKQALQLQVARFGVEQGELQVVSGLPVLISTGGLLVVILLIAMLTTYLRHGLGFSADVPVQPDRVTVTMTRGQLEEFIRWQRGK